MDLRAEALRLALDSAAVDVCQALRDAGLAHVLLKGPSTAAWLYDPPRAYHDVDVLIRATAAQEAAEALEAAQVAFRVGGRVGEEAPHSLMMRAANGCEVDLHVSLPTVPPSDEVWLALAEHVETMDLGVGTVPVLDHAGRCLVLALHALNNGPDSGLPVLDLHLARTRTEPAVWTVAAAIAARMGAADLLEGALAMTDGRPALRGRARLYASGAPSAAFGLSRLLAAPRRDRPGLIWRELFPSRGFMRYQTGRGDLPGSELVAAYLRRWWQLARALPSAVRAVRRNSSGSDGPV